MLKGDSHVISGSSSGNIIIWDFLDANEVKRLKISHSTAVITSLARHPTREDILVANRREVQVWSSPDYEIIEES